MIWKWKCKAKDHVSKESICPIPRIGNGREYGGKGCMKMGRWNEGERMEGGKTCALPKHV